MHELKTYLHVVCPAESKEACIRALSAFTDNFSYSVCVNGAISFSVCVDTRYDVDANVMLRRTLAPFFGREEELKEALANVGAGACLEIVADLDRKSSAPTPILGPEADIIAFCYRTGILPDIDYYI